jgi:8-oxo-dGTP pyrophosphatase MutT (NUDIX family)
MNIFINDKLIKIISFGHATDLAYTSYFDLVLDLRLAPLKTEKIQGHCLLLNADLKSVDRLFDFLEKNPKANFLSISVSSKNHTELIEHIENMYTIIKAAGGIVEKGEQILLIHRLGKWDLPKGKLEKNEKSKLAAVREVEEECGVKAVLKEKICTTWHTYKLNEKKILKKTKWYSMTLQDDSNMAPQTEEDIDQIEWMDAKRAENAMANSYSSIRFVLDYYNSIK